MKGVLRVYGNRATFETDDENTILVVAAPQWLHYGSYPAVVADSWQVVMGVLYARYFGQYADEHVRMDNLEPGTILIRRDEKTVGVDYYAVVRV